MNICKWQLCINHACHYIFWSTCECIILYEAWMIKQLRSCCTLNSKYSWQFLWNIDGKCTWHVVWTMKVNTPATMNGKYSWQFLWIMNGKYSRQFLWIMNGKYSWLFLWIMNGKYSLHIPWIMNSKIIFSLIMNGIN